MKPADSEAAAAQAAAPVSPSQPASQPWPSRRSAYYSLFVLTIVVMFTVIDRQILSLMIEPIKADFHISDTKVAFLIGAAFSITYGLAGIPIARFADRANRRNLIAVAISFWSLCTMGCGLAQGYAGLVLARLGVGIGESAYGPASWSIATDNFPREKVAVATSTYGLGAMAGVGLASFMGGSILALVEGMPAVALPFGGVIRPWQFAFLIVGLPGLLWSIMVLTTAEPPRRGAARAIGKRGASLREVASWIRSDWRTYLAVIGGTCMKQLVATGSSTWGVTFYHREFGWSLARAGITIGLLTLIISPPAMILGGKLSERWTRRGRPDANLRIVVTALCFSVPLLIAFPLMPDPRLAVAGQALTIFFGALGFGPGHAAYQVITPNRMRAQVSSISQFSTNVIAFSLSPLIVAVCTDYLFRDPHALKYSMALSATIMGSLALVVTVQGLKPYARAYERAVRQDL